MLINAYGEGKSIILMGDFNIDLLKESHSKNKWTDMYPTFELKQTISEPTRITSTSKTLIDHIYISNKLSQHCTCQAVLGISDHSVVLTNLKLETPHCSKRSHQTITYRNFKKLHPPSLFRDLSNISWQVYEKDVVNEALKNFMLDLTLIVDKHIPLVSKRVQRCYQQNWMSHSILKSIKPR